MLFVLFFVISAFYVIKYNSEFYSLSEEVLGPFHAIFCFKCIWNCYKLLKVEEADCFIIAQDYGMV